MNGTSPRIQREISTVEAMIRIYCRGRHGGRSVCISCSELSDYARERLRKCPFGEAKTVCSRCAVHCYRPEMRARIRTVMRYSGPRMLYSHPLMTIRHMIDKRRKAPLKQYDTRR